MEAEAELYRRFAPRVRLFGLKHLRDDGAADDLAQQALLVTIERLRANDVREPDQIGSFILGTSRMLAQAQHRIERRRAALRNEYARLTASSVQPAARIDSAKVEECLRQLGQRERSVLILTFFAERPLPRSATRWRCRRGRSRRASPGARPHARLHGEDSPWRMSISPRLTSSTIGRPR